MGGISVWQLLILLVIVLVIFGTKRLRNAGSDIGGAIKGFREGMADKEDEKKSSEQLAADKLDSADSVQERAVVDPKDEK
ncbi:MAG: Sec-independent protein translocase subunit TatA [Xanthomonadales bacterium]|nr:Sec-independent protein translocase subunit TatA [Xanthomonadales bacterium]